MLENPCSRKSQSVVRQYLSFRLLKNPAILVLLYQHFLMGFPVEIGAKECDSCRAMDSAGLEEDDPSVYDQTDVPTLSFIGGWSCEMVSFVLRTYRNMPNKNRKIKFE